MLRFSRCQQGTAAVEFALILPIMLLLCFGILEFGTYILDLHRTSDATRRAARQATISAPIANLSNVATAPITCSGTSSGAVSCGPTTISAAGSFATILAAAQSIMPTVQPQNLVIIYRNSGLGDASMPTGVLPYVTISVTGLSHQFFALPGLAPGFMATLPLPAFTTSQIAGGVGQ